MRSEAQLQHEIAQYLNQGAGPLGKPVINRSYLVIEILETEDSIFSRTGVVDPKVPVRGDKMDFIKQDAAQQAALLMVKRLSESIEECTGAAQMVRELKETMSPKQIVRKLDEELT